jgi:hypothetical protein
LKEIIFALVIAVLFSTSLTFAQEISIGQPAIQIVNVTISEDGSAHIVHVVDPSSDPQQLNVISNDFTNLQITDENGKSVQYGEGGGELAGFLLFPSKQKILVEYDLDNAVSEKNGMLTWNYLYLATTAFYLPEKVDLIFANGNPVSIGNLDGIRCHGCQIKLEYRLDQKEIVEKVQWEEREFNVRIMTNANVSSFEFDQPNKRILFDVNDKDQYVTLLIPLELLGNPYQVSLNGEIIPQNPSYPDEKSVLLGIKPNETGTVQIVGTTVIPEFPIAAVLVLAVAMIFAARYTNNFNLR